MCIFNKETIRKRNNISKLNSKSFSKQLFLGHITLTLSLWAIFVLISFILYKDIMFNINGLLGDAPNISGRLIFGAPSNGFEIAISV